jgi:alkylation response protein AidB-like acyl-CoA dehydrogenase
MATLIHDVDTRILDKKDDLVAFRAAIRAWIAETLPDGTIEKMTESEDKSVEIQIWWMNERAKVGMAIPHWPKEYGGADLSLAHQVILADEIARANAPPTPAQSIAHNHLPGTLLSWGTEEQKRRWLTGIANGDIWCQGFSEPGAGSDLAALRTRAEKKGDHYVVNGQKIWSSEAMYASMCILLARTDPSAPKHAGISFFLLDMKAPGVEVRPISQVNGRQEFAEIFLTDVKIPAENLVGPENQGWKVAQSTLAAERGVMPFEFAERGRYAMEKYLNKSIRDNAAWLQDEQLRREFYNWMAELHMHRRMIRTLLRSPHGADLGILPSIIKMHGAQFRQGMSSLITKMAGLEGQRFEIGFEDFYHPEMFTFISSFSWTIAAGSNEIMRNMIAERGLGMPRG